jgi:mRNA capping enzyme, beta chain
MQHRHYNTLLNKLKEESDKPGYHSSPIAYTHSHLVDSFYAPENPRERDKIRVTRNEKTGEVIATVRKVRLGNLDIYNPKRAADWRISVNVEVPGAYSSLVVHKMRDTYRSFQYNTRWVRPRTHGERTVSAILTRSST